MKKRQLIVAGSILLIIAGWVVFAFVSSLSEYTPARQLVAAAGLACVAAAMYFLVRHSPFSAMVVGLATALAALANISLWVVFTSHGNGDRVQTLLSFLLETGLMVLVQLPSGVLIAVGGLLAASRFGARFGARSTPSRRLAIAAAIAAPLVTLLGVVLIVLASATMVYEAQIEIYPAPPSTSNANEYLPILLTFLAGVTFTFVGILTRLAPVGGILSGALLLAVGIAGLFGLGESWLGQGASRTVELEAFGGFVLYGPIAFVGAAILAVGLAWRHRSARVAAAAPGV